MRSKAMMVVAAAVLLAACLPGTNELVGTAGASGDVAGFWRGLWHGLIVCISFLVSLFTDDVQLYEVHNNGNWYDAGYFFGLLISLGGSGGGGARWGRRKT